MNGCADCGRAFGKRRRCYVCHGRPRAREHQRLHIEQGDSGIVRSAR